MGFLQFIAGIIAKAVVAEGSSLLKDEREKATKIQAIGKEAKEHIEEWDNAQSDQERIAVLRKVANFSDLKHLLL
jgi:hypothetical protein